jgi:hypothetical protein
MTAGPQLQLLRQASDPGPGRVQGHQGACQPSLPRWLGGAGGLGLLVMGCWEYLRSRFNTTCLVDQGLEG